ncbi:hypothetical protein FKW77_007387 [Venturia effusa]|uniref:Protein kinase domain-containing protein n=1 Tax=Venturia effusa TaxID=50376 RepID=A0A517LN64_9PEZI|nr:hypothetical protein FKW77_007387 [Venturia effusa]
MGSLQDVDDGLRRAALSRKLRAPVLKPPPGYRRQVKSPGSCAAIWLSEDGKSVLKAPLSFYLDGCDTAATKEYATLEQESIELIEREKLIYRHLGHHQSILHSLRLSELGLTFPHMKNGNLRDILRKNAPRPTALTLQWILTILEGFDYIHSLQVFQGDVSARNVLVADDLSVVLSDFSGSRIGEKSCLVRPETRYEIQTMQPFEVARRSDIFAIGSLIYEIIEGRPPYDELEEDEVVKRFQQAKFPSTAHMILGEVIKGCWAGGYDTVKQALEDVLMRRGQILDD